MAFLDELGATLKGAGKVLLLSRPGAAGRYRAARSGRIFILGNGPSLREAIDRFGARLADEDTLAVNFALNAPEIQALRPGRYVLADPHFFRRSGEDANVDALWENIGRADWSLTLFVPAAFVAAARARLASPTVIVKPFNAVGVEGFRAFRRRVYKSALAMPRPRNVLIPSVMLAIWSGYKTIVLLGADHSWMKTLAVSDDNEVVSVQPHFYKEDSREEKRVRHEYRGYRLHHIVESFAVAFKAYHHIAEFASAEDVEIVNATPGSFIDAFRRADLSDILSRPR